MYAVFQSGGKQHRVAEGQTIVTCKADREEEILGINDRLQLADLERRYQHWRQEQGLDD